MKYGKLQTKFFSNDIIIYLALFPFLYPKGFSEYFGIYKKFFTGWMYLSIVIILVAFVYAICRIFRYHIQYNNCLAWMSLYHIYMLIMTLIVQGGINEGLQKIFATPVLCLVCVIFMKKNINRFVECLANIMIFNFALTIIIFNPIIASKYFAISTNLMFIGHVQVAAQLGILGIFVSFVLKKLHPNNTIKSKMLFILSILIMITSFTSASFICLFVMVLSFILVRFFRLGKIFELDSRIYIAFIFALNVVFLFLLYKNNWNLSNIGLTTTLNGRFVIWKEIVNMLQNHLLLGYGAFGGHIKVYWHVWTGQLDGMTYAHSQLFQLLLDGGIGLFIIFLIMIFVYVDKVKKSSNVSLVRMANICLISILIVMVTESVAEYYYIFIFWSLLAFLPKIAEICDSN